MIPELELQLQSVIKALKDTVMPAVDPAQRMAMEQLSLSIATLSMVRERLPYAGLREWQDLSDAIGLGHAVSEAVSSVSFDQAMREGEALLNAPRAAPEARPAATRAILSQVSEAVKGASREDVTALMRTVVEASRPALDLARAWCKASGFELDPEKMPDVEVLLTRPTGTE